jgi:transcriptional/translational regulatory protein YebC/TACO1
MPDPASEQICCEGYGPGGVAVIVTCARTERALPEESLRRAFREQGGRLGAQGSVGYLFRPVGVLRVAGAPGLAEQAMAAGVEECLAAPEGTVDLYTDPQERDAIEQRLGARGHRCVARGSGWRAMQTLQPAPSERQRLGGLVRELMAIEGVGHVYTNAQTTDQLLAPV